MSDEDRFDNEPLRTSRDRGAVEHALGEWLRAQVGDDAAITGLAVPSGSGMSSETLLIDARWADGDHQLVARLAPAEADTPVFETYDLELQFELLRLVGDHSTVPVPRPLWLETDPAAIGSPFFVMERKQGRVPADIPPYVFEGWLLDATPQQQRTLQDASVGVIAALHEIDVADHDVAFLEVDAPGDSPLERHVNSQRHFYEWVRGDRAHPIVEDAFAWLDDNWPDEGPTVIGWGDARIGNIMYEADGFEPVAVFDWEMAAIAPQELDLGWMMFMHTFFQEIAQALELPGMPDFMRRDDVVATYEAASGRPVRNLEWFEAYAALRHGIIMTRVVERSVHFGEAEWPDDIDDVIPHKHVLEQMLAGTWWG